MRTSVFIPDPVADEVRSHLDGASFSSFVRISVEDRLRRIKRAAVLEQMAEGYRAEADNPSLAPEWAAVETEAW